MISLMGSGLGVRSRMEGDALDREEGGLDSFGSIGSG
jgi:hypothetical protein